MSETKVFVLLQQKGKSFKPIREKLEEMGAFYTGIGYAVPQNNETLLRSLVRHLPDVQIIPMPLSEGQTFESYRLSHKVSHLQELYNKADIELMCLLESLKVADIENHDIEIIRNITAAQREDLRELMEMKEQLQKQIEWAKAMEKTMESCEAPSTIKFICEQEVNYLRDPPTDMPRLVNYLEGGQQKPFIPKGIVAQLVGAGGVGKTHALAQLALAVTTGSNWLGIYPIEKPGYVFMCLGENKDADIHRLLNKTVKSQMSNADATFLTKDPLEEAGKRLAVMSCTGKDATFIRDGRPTSYYGKILQDLKDREPEEGWTLIILDPISRFMGADAENDNAAATLFIALLERITLELKGQPTLIFGHHMNKSGVSGTSTDQGAARGSSAITDGVRWQANLEKIANPDDSSTFVLNKITMRPVKSNFTVLLPPQKLQKDRFGNLSALVEDDQEDAGEFSRSKNIKKSSRK